MQIPVAAAGFGFVVAILIESSTKNLKVQVEDGKCVNLSRGGVAPCFLTGNYDFIPDDATT